MGAERKVLIVEDDRDLCDAVSESLVEAGYDVAVAGNGAAAMEVLETSRVPPGLVLLDLMMPVMDGEEFLQEIRKQPRWAALPVVVFTADGQAVTKVTSLGAQGALRKPVKLDDLLDTVSRYWAPN